MDKQDNSEIQRLITQKAMAYDLRKEFVPGRSYTREQVLEIIDNYIDKSEN